MIMYWLNFQKGLFVLLIVLIIVVFLLVYFRGKNMENRDKIIFIIGIISIGLIVIFMTLDNWIERTIS